MQDGKLTVKQATSLDNESSILIFQYQLSEQLSWSMQTVLSGHSLFVGLPNGELLKGTKEGYVISMGCTVFLVEHFPTETIDCCYAILRLYNAVLF